MIRANHPGRLHRPGIRPLLAALALGTSLAACEFDEPVIVTASRAPVITRLEVPEQVTAGGAVNVEVQAFGRRGIEELALRLRGAYVADSVISFSPVRTDSVQVNRVFTVPDTVTGLLLRVEAVAVDSTGAESRVEVRDVDVLAPAGS